MFLDSKRLGTEVELQFVDEVRGSPRRKSWTTSNVTTSLYSCLIIAWQRVQDIVVYTAQHSEIHKV